MINSDTTPNPLLRYELFKTKQAYKDFSQAWATAVNSDLAKSKMIPCYEFFRDERTGEWFSSDTKTGLNRAPGWITAAHVVLYNIIRGLPFDRGFTDVTNQTKLINQTYFNWAYINACYILRTRIKWAQNITAEQPHWPMSEYHIAQLDTFLGPFKGTFTTEMLAMVPLPPVNIKRYSPPVDIQTTDATEQISATA